MRKLLVTLLCLVFAGCATFSSRMNYISLGMTKGEVIQVMGQPVSTSAQKNIEVFNYALTETSNQWAYGWTTPYYIAFKGGKVVSYGRTGDFGTTAYPKQVIELDEKVTTNNTK